MPEMPKPKAPKATSDIKAALMSMTASAGWAIVVKILDDNIKYLETAILDKFDPVNKVALNDADVELLRQKRLLNLDVRNTPENYIQVLDETGEVPKNYDPYFATNEEIKKASERRSLTTEKE